MNAAPGAPSKTVQSEREQEKGGRRGGDRKGGMGIIVGGGGGWLGDHFALNCPKVKVLQKQDKKKKRK